MIKSDSYSFERKLRKRHVESIRDLNLSFMNNKTLNIDDKLKYLNKRFYKYYDEIYNNKLSFSSFIFFINNNSKFAFSTYRTYAFSILIHLLLLFKLGSV